MTNDELNQTEDALIDTFRNHLVFKKIEVISETALLTILLQRRFLSLIFTPVYELSIDIIQNPKCKQILRKILRDEYPLRNFEETPTHREDMFHDLIMIGARRENILKTLPTRSTRKVIQETFAMVNRVAAEESAELKILTMLRFWGEVLVAFEYKDYWKRIAHYFTPDTYVGASRFYQPHFEHDVKTKSLFDTSILETTHSDRIGFYLSKMLETEHARKDFLNTERAILQVKYKFYDQFIPLINTTEHQPLKLPECK